MEGVLACRDDDLEEALVLCDCGVDKRTLLTLNRDAEGVLEVVLFWIVEEEAELNFGADDGRDPLRAAAIGVPVASSCSSNVTEREGG